MNILDKEIKKKEKRLLNLCNQIKFQRFYLAIFLSITFIFSYYISQLYLDLTDESFYLVSIKNPYNFPYSNSATKFAYVFHPLLILSKSIWAMRLITNFITFFLLVKFGKQCLKIQMNYNASNKIIIGAAVLFQLNLIFAYGYIGSPSYNTLTLWGLLLVGMSLTSLNKKNQKLRLSLSLLILFLAKPTSCIAVIILIFLFYVKKQNLLFAIIETTKILCRLTIAILLAWTITDKSPVQAFGNLRVAINYLSDSHQIGFDYQTFYKILPLNFLSFSILSITFFVVYKHYYRSKNENFLIYSVIAFFPLAGSVGSDNNYFLQSLFYISIDLILLLSIEKSVIEETINFKLLQWMIIVSISFSILQGYNSPYRSNENILNNNVKITIPDYGSLYVSKKTFNQINPVIKQVIENSSKNDFILDATGNLPALSLLTGLQPIGSPWVGVGSDYKKEFESFKVKKCADRSRLIIATSNVNNNFNLSRFLDSFELNLKKNFKQIYSTNKFYYSAENKFGNLQVFKSNATIKCNNNS